MPRPTVIVVCRSFTSAWSQPRLELCIFAQVPAHVYTRPFYVIKCFFFFSPTCTQTILVLIHTDTHIQHVQSPIGRRPQARSCIWQESNWACLMVDIQERSREKQTCSDEGERRAISLESSLSLSLPLSLYTVSISLFLSLKHTFTSLPLAFALTLQMLCQKCGGRKDLLVPVKLCGVSACQQIHLFCLLPVLSVVVKLNTQWGFDKIKLPEPIKIWIRGFHCN